MFFTLPLFPFLSLVSITIFLRYTSLSLSLSSNPSHTHHPLTPNSSRTKNQHRPQLPPPKHALLQIPQSHHKIPNLLPQNPTLTHHFRWMDPAFHRRTRKPHHLSSHIYNPQLLTPFLILHNHSYPHPPFPPLTPLIQPNDQQINPHTNTN